MKKKIHIPGKNICLILLGFLITGIYSLQAQNVCISGDGSAPLASAMLEVKSINSGFLVPRMTLAQKTAIASPATGLLVYQTDGTTGFWYHNGTIWVQVGTGSSGWGLAGNTLTGTLPASPVEWIGTVNAADWIIKTGNTERMRVLSGGNVGIGTSAPASRLDVYGAAGASPAKFGTPDGYVLVGPANNGWSHFTTDRARYYFNKGITVDEGLIGSYDENLSLQTSGTTRITALTANGNVGIGTTTPAQRLDVSGNLQFSGALMPNGIAGTSGSFLRSTGAGTPPVWTAGGVNVASVNTVESTTNLCVNSGTFTSYPGCTIVLNLVVGQRVVAFAEAGLMVDNNCDGTSDTRYANVDVRIAVNGVDFPNGAWLRTSLDNSSAYVVFNGISVIGEYTVPANGAYTFALQARWLSGSGYVISGGDNTSSLQATMVLIVYTP